MLVRIVNRYINKGMLYMPGDLVEMPEDLVRHLEEVSTVQELKSPNATKVYEAIVNGATIADAVKKKINLREDAEKHYFTLIHKIDGKDKKFFYQVPKDPAVRVLE